MAVSDLTVLGRRDGAIAIIPEASSTGGQSGPRLRGRMLVPAHDCWYPPAVDAQDMLLVDFDAAGVESGQVGLFLVEEMASDRIVWRGCRKIAAQPECVRIDVSGTGDWMPVDSLENIGVRVVGRVDEVYKPTLNPGIQW